MTYRLDWFDLALLKMFAVGVVLAAAVSWRGWGRLLKGGRND